MGRMYRINPTCPHCGEQHEYWEIRLTDEEQEQMDRYLEENKEKSSLALLFGDPGIVVSRELTCCRCKGTFTARVGLWRQNEVGFHAPDFIEVGRGSL